MILIERVNGTLNETDSPDVVTIQRAQEAKLLRSLTHVQRNKHLEQTEAGRTGAISGLPQWFASHSG